MLEACSDLFSPIPIPFWGLFNGKPGEVAEKKGKTPLLRKFTFVVVMAFNYWYFGRPYFDSSLLQRSLNVQHRKILRHVRPLVRSEGQLGDIHVCKAGWCFPELVARLGELSDALTKLGPSCDPYSRSSSGQCEVVQKDNTTTPELEPYRSLDASRMEVEGGTLLITCQVSW